MKVLLINGSPRKGGNTNLALEEVAKALQSNGVDTEIYQIGTGAIHGCIACGKCRELGKCVFDDDGVNEVREKMKSADGLIVGTPVYYASPNGSLLSFLDRLFYAGGEFAYKPAAAIACARRGGTTASFDVLNKYFTICQMPIVSSTYWNNIHGAAPGQAAMDAEGLQVMRNLGNNMAWLLKSIEAGKAAGIEKPKKEEKREVTNFIR